MRQHRLQDRLLDTDVALQFFRRVLHLAKRQGFVSNEHFSLDGTIIEKLAPVTRTRASCLWTAVVPTGLPDATRRADFTGKTRSNATQQSTTDPQARLYKKGEFTGAKLRYMTHALSKKRNGLSSSMSRVRRPQVGRKGKRLSG